MASLLQLASCSGDSEPQIAESYKEEADAALPGKIRELRRQQGSG